MSDLYTEALDTFRELLDEARAAGDPEPTAMTLATASRDGRPAARTVLLKGVDARGFVFFTNFDSRKGQHLRENPQAALLFLWKTLRHQVQAKIEGRVERVSDEEADAYFASRPRMSQLGAWASLQSQTLDSRETFEKRLADYEREFAGGEVPRPPHWGGFRVVPDRIEFWYGAEFRLHERHCYERVDGKWIKRLLYP
ncbi:pyridoxamine 5'-phosphate oxidase [Rehaibacterium terrae]|jgi:pyridoxamine 5'-phosphate oxidase|uniref:Pyridoxine/pyridoxamine 5'-phosphate oxidase n=1 Tax=Rehaibacterium terrae TaxID=1341696 RepID=A0A7W7Y0N0_9GAMM|nr:pyridoxamine 5'-phosphate oxidase [Rehaibacterium terrae]MBB5015920.1 pyridoxamine 5'-phosphate oxidase [Rehaibacterium terrae]